MLQEPNTGELMWRNYVQGEDDLIEVLNQMVRYHFNQRYQSASQALQAVNELKLQQNIQNINMRSQQFSRRSRQFMPQLFHSIGQVPNFLFIIV
jgi:hypothetical protein